MSAPRLTSSPGCIWLICLATLRGAGIIMIEVTIQYFALLRDERGTGEETVRTAATTVADLYHEAQVAHGLTVDSSSLQVAVNDDIVPWDHPLKPGDQIVFLPPFSGG